MEKQCVTLSVSILTYWSGLDCDYHFCTDDSEEVYICMYIFVLVVKGTHLSPVFSFFSLHCSVFGVHKLKQHYQQHCTLCQVTYGLHARKKSSACQLWHACHRFIIASLGDYGSYQLAHC